MPSFASLIALLSPAASALGMIDIASTYGAAGDGKTDDTAAIQKALDEHAGKGKVLYLRPGTYLISRTLAYRKGEGIWGFTNLWGAGPARTTIRLKDGVFGDSQSPKPMLTLQAHGSADWFHNSVQNLTLHSGENNPGAVGVEFYSNNTGVMRDVAIVSGDGKGRFGLDLAHGDMNGPLLVSRVSVKGFDVGIRAGWVVNSQTLEHITLRGQKEAGIVCGGQVLAIRKLDSEGEAPAIVNHEGGFITLLDSTLKGKGGPAIVNKGFLAARQVAASGFAFTVNDTQASLADFATRRVGPALPRLAVKETPPVPADLPRTSAASFGATPSDGTDDTDAIQAALNAATGEVVFANGSYRISKSLIVPPSVRRLNFGMSFLDIDGVMSEKGLPVFRLGGRGSPLFIDSFATSYNGGKVWFIQNDSDRTLVLRDGQINFQGAASYRGAGRGEVYIENVVGGDWQFGRQSVWARQFNAENEGTKVSNAGGRLWVLGLKTERGGTLVQTSGGGQSEVWGGFSYTTTAGALAPMFVVEKGSLSASFTETCFNGDPFRTVLRAERDWPPSEFASRANGAALPLLTVLRP